jgi:thiamine biosynthesis lipoprotein
MSPFLVKIFKMNKWIVFLSVLILTSCNKKQIPVKIQGTAQGTYYSIIYFDSLNRNFKKQIDSILNAFDKSVSLWVKESTLSKVNNNDTTVIIDKWFEENFKLSKEVAKATGGAFDFTVEPLVQAWGFGFDETTNVDSTIIDSILQFTGYDKVRLSKHKIIKSDDRIKFDFNAVAQGYSVDVIGNFLQNKGIKNYLVDIGGEVKAKGTKPDGKLWRVGVEKPAKTKDSKRELKLVIGLKNMSIATSGNYRKYYEKNGIRYSHTINPATGYPVKHSLLSVSVLSDSTAVADAYATAFMVMGYEKARTFVENNKNLEAFFIYYDSTDNYKTYATPGFRQLIEETY